MTPASAIPFSASAQWFDRAWNLWCRRPVFFAGTALLMLALRWGVDLVPFGGGAFIFLSYLTDALIFAMVWLALSQADGGGGLMDGWRLLNGRRGRVARAGLWGLPSAAVGFLLLALEGPLFEAIGVALGARVAGWLMLGWIFAVGWICCTLLFGALFACIEAARGEDGLWTAGLKGMRAAYVGWRPLLGVWTAFVCGAALCAALTAGVMGHLGLTAIDGVARDALEYWINWPALFIAVMALLALLTPCGGDLLAAAEAGGQHDGLTLAAFGETAAVRLGMVLKTLAAAVVLSGLFVIDVGAGSIVVGALGLWLTGRALAKAAPAWGDSGASLWARWRWLVLTGLPAVILWLGVAGM